MRRSRSFALLFLATLSGCQGWRVQTTPPAEYIRTARPERIQLIRTDNTKAELFAPQLVGDSVRGFPTEKAIRPLTIPMEEVEKVAIRKFSLGKTALLVLSVGAGLFLYDQLMALNQNGQGF
jgi:hypothetical protein